MTSTHEKINYIEFQVKNIEKSKTFYTEAFAWTFTDYSDSYVAFHNAGIDGGFYQSEAASNPQNGAILAVFYSETLESTQAKIKNAGGTIVKDIFKFPGGRRFHFADPSGNEFAVWSDKGDIGEF